MEDQKNVLLRFHLYFKLITYCDRAELKGILLYVHQEDYTDNRLF